MTVIRKAEARDKAAIWRIISSVIATGDTYVFDPSSTKDEMLAYWFAPDKWTYVAVDDSAVVGTFWLKANQPGLGSHIANAAYMVDPAAMGRGIGRKMASWSIEEAGRLGFTAMQFNFVVKSNTVAVELWKSIGFEVIGEIPDAFRHRELGSTNALIMYRKL
ncbi:MAG: N-acetyltransferase family protein [Pyrinomonadaceae bacterium]